jgi:WD40 repeat protein
VIEKIRLIVMLRKANYTENGNSINDTADFEYHDIEIATTDCCSENITEEMSETELDYSVVEEKELRLSPRSESDGVNKISGNLLSNWVNISIQILKTSNFQFVTQIETNHTAKINSVVPITKKRVSRSNSVEDSGMIVTASDDRTCQVWDIWDNELLAVFKGHTKTPFIVSPLDDGQHILSASDSLRSEVFIWKKDTGELVQNLNPNGDTFDTVESASQFTSWNGTAYLAFATNKGKVYIYRNDRNDTSSKGF